VFIPEEGLALRGTFVINPEGVIKTAEVHSNEIARDVKETLRKLKAAQYTAAHPAKSALPSGTKAPRRSPRPSTSSARSKHLAVRKPGPRHTVCVPGFFVPS
jgi:alkyl hydroperoxide reductase subunit AhpC